MRSISGRLGWTAASVAAAFALGACGASNGSTDTRTALDDGLQRDLQLAAAASVELAGGGQGLPRTRFVSAAEGAPAGEGRETTRADARGTARHRAPTKGVRRVAQVHPAPAASDEPAPTVAVADAPSAVSGTDAAPSPTPAEAPAPAPEPIRPVANTGDGEGTGRGPSDEGQQGGRRRGGWIGVVLRGGGVGDDDHCERDQPGRRGGGIVGRTSLPRRGWRLGWPGAGPAGPRDLAGQLPALTDPIDRRTREPRTPPRRPGLACVRGGVKFAHAPERRPAPPTCEPEAPRMATPITPAAPSTDPLTVRSSREGAVTRITIDRPSRRNAVDLPTLAALRAALVAAGEDEGRVVILTGAGEAFCAGADLAATNAEDIARFDVSAALRDYNNPVVTAIRALPKPVIARVHGPAAGVGMNFALACDLIVASESATFGQVFVKIGLMPDGGSTYFLPRLVGYHKAFELMALGDLVSAPEAARLGIVTRVVAADALDAAVDELAMRLARAPRTALAAIKAGLHHGERSDLADALAFEAERQDACFHHPDFVEGVTAFLQKRAPRFA